MSNPPSIGLGPALPEQSFIMSLVESKGVVAGGVAALGSMAFMGLQGGASVQYGALVALGVSLGDVLLTVGGVGSKLESYMTMEPFQTFLDPNDFLGAAAGTALLGWVVGMQGRQLGIATAVGAVAGGVAPKIGGYMLMQSLIQNKPKSGQ